MPKQRKHLTVGCRCPSAFCVLIFIAATVLAQQSPPPPGNRNPKRSDREREVREKALRGAEIIPAVEKVNQQAILAAVEKLREDFERIQVVRNEVVRNLLAKKPLDYKLIADQAAEIHKRADRLKSYMLPPALDDKEKHQDDRAEFNSEEMKGALVRLCNLIVGFVENPVFKNPETISFEQSDKLRGDLVNIIELSGKVKRSAESMSATPR